MAPGGRQRAYWNWLGWFPTVPQASSSDTGWGGVSAPLLTDRVFRPGWHLGTIWAPWCAGQGPPSRPQPILMHTGMGNAETRDTLGCWVSRPRACWGHPPQPPRPHHPAALTPRTLWRARVGLLLHPLLSRARAP